MEGDGLECTLTAKSLGSATIIATVEGEKVASGTVTVVDTAPGVVSIRVSQDEVTISSGETYTINATVEMEKADMTPATIKWSSNNTSVAEVDSEGVITAREVGNAIIKGVAGEKTVEIAVEVVENPNSTPHDSTQDAGREPEEGQDATNNNNNSNNSNSNNSSNNQNNSSNGGGTTSGNSGTGGTGDGNQTNGGIGNTTTGGTGGTADGGATGGQGTGGTDAGTGQ